MATCQVFTTSDLIQPPQFGPRETIFKWSQGIEFSDRTLTRYKTLGNISLPL